MEHDEPLLRRRDFILGGVAIGSVLAAGAILPLGLVLRDDEDLAQGIGGVQVAFFPRTKVGTIGQVSTTDPLFFDYPLTAQSNVLVDVGQRAIGGIGQDRSVVAFSNICTHMGCPITDYNADERVLGPCVCHFTTFDLAKDGQVVLGQATQNLPRVLLELDGDDIIATGVFRLISGYANNLGGVNVEIAAANGATTTPSDGATDE